MQALLSRQLRQSSAFEMLVSYGLHKLPSERIATMLPCPEAFSVDHGSSVQDNDPQ